MSGLEVMVEMNLLNPPQPRVEGLNQEDHQEVLTNGTTSASEKKIKEPEDFKKRECNTFIEDLSRDGRCQCKRPRDKHPPDIKTAEDTDWTTELHSSEQPTDAFGRLRFEGDDEYMNRHFLRLSSGTEPSLLYDLMTRKKYVDGGWGLDPPFLVVSVVGGSAEVKPWVQEVIREGLVKALDKISDVEYPWILTEGFDAGVGKCVGEAVKDSRTRVRVLGISPWGVVHNKDQLVNKGGYVGYVRYSVENKTRDSCCLEKHHHRFLLVDDGTEGRGGGEKKNFRAKFEEHIPTRYISRRDTGETSTTIPVLCVLVSGELSMLKRVSASLRNNTPWLVMAGSGGMAELLSDISTASDVKDAVRVYQKHFPNHSKARRDQCKSIYDNRELIKIYHEEKERAEDFDTAIIKALMPASERRASGNAFPYGRELFLAWAWKREDFARSHLFKRDIKINTMFVDVIVNILTVGHLEKIYSSVKKFMGEEKPFTSGKKALEHVKELGLDVENRNKLCESPWFLLFIWTVLENHSDWAVFFWEMTEEPVLNALSACKMLKEMSKMAYETETKRSMEKLSLKFENLANDAMGLCYQSSENNSLELLNRDSPVWGTNCFQMAIDAESRLFFNHDGLESVLSQVWWGDMKKDTPWWKFLLTFVCPLLLCTNLITFEDSETDDSRWKKFWSAPITTFVGNAVMYILFLFLFAYVLLVDFKPAPPSGPSISEYVLYFWVFTFLCEEIRQAFSVKLYWKDKWNWCDLFAISLFILGLICRMFEQSFEFGRGVLCIDYMVFTIRLLHISTIHKGMGPKIIIIGKMMKDVISFLFILGVWLSAYGVATQALLYKSDSNLNRILRRVLYRPYLYIFGDMNLEEIDVHGTEWEQKCTDNMTLIEGGAEPCRSEFHNLLVIVLLVVFLLVTNILLINLLIAILSNTFNKVKEKSTLYWRFQHYKLVKEYQSRPGSELRRARKVKIWETKQKSKFLKDQSEIASDSERIKQISDKVDRMEKEQQNQLKQLTKHFTEQLNEIKASLETKMEKCISDALGQILDRLNKPSST